MSQLSSTGVLQRVSEISRATPLRCNQVGVWVIKWENTQCGVWQWAPYSLHASFCVKVESFCHGISNVALLQIVFTVQDNSIADFAGLLPVGSMLAKQQCSHLANGSWISGNRRARQVDPQH
jgi:hypothetical protein